MLLLLLFLPLLLLNASRVRRVREEGQVHCDDPEPGRCDAEPDEDDMLVRPCEGQLGELKVQTRTIAETGADVLLAGDLGCLMNMAGKLKREGTAIEVRHVAEVLAGMTDKPAIGGGRR